MEGLNFEQRHGKSRVRVGRVWRSSKQGLNFMVEWNVNISLLSNCNAAYFSDDNSDIVATDTMKNTVKYPSLPYVFLRRGPGPVPVPVPEFEFGLVGC